MRTDPLIISICILGSILIEALTDGFKYLSDTKGLNGTWYHLFQQVHILYTYQCYKYIDIDILSINMIYFFIGYSLYHYSLFDLLYKFISKNKEVGRGSMFDKLYNKLPILYNGRLKTLAFSFSLTILILRFN